MKPHFFGVLFLAAAGALGQTPAAPSLPQAPSTSAAPAAGATEATTPVYGPRHVQDEALQLSFDLPDGVLFRQDITDKINKGFTKKSPGGDLCVQLEALAYDPKVIRRIYVYHYRGDCMADGVTQEQLRGIPAHALEAMLHQYGKQAMTSPIDYQFGGQPAAVVSGNVYSQENHGVLFGEMACAAVEKDAVCWAFVSSTLGKDAELATMPITIGKQSAVPAIPLDMSQMVAFPFITFHDDPLHFDITYPGTFASVQPRSESLIDQKLSEKGRIGEEAKKCTKVLLSADELAEDSRSNLTILSIPLSCISLKITASTLRELALGGAQEIAKQGHADLIKPVPYQLDGREAYFIHMQMHLKEGAPSYLAEACTLVGDTAVCWQIVSNKADRMRTLAPSIKLAFNNRLDVPLFPSELLSSITP